jgi:hypothetical protein
LGKVQEEEETKEEKEERGTLNEALFRTIGTMPTGQPQKAMHIMVYLDLPQLFRI